MRSAAELLGPAWAVTPLPIRPFPGFWGFNPSIHHDPADGLWRCAIRLADYHAPSGVVQANMKRGGNVETRNVLVTLDPATWTPTAAIELLERDGLPRHRASSRGYEDLRLFRTERDGLCAIATTMQLRPDTKQEMVVLRFGPDPLTDGGEIAIVSATPIRGAWGEIPQKNWAPFDGTMGVRLLYSIERGLVFDETGPVGEIGAAMLPAPVVEAPRPAYRGPQYNGGVETRHTPRTVAMARADGNMPSQRTPPPPRGDWSSPGLRGGSQLVALGDDLWLGIGHEMVWQGARTRKLYWHSFYTCNDAGKLLERSESFKLSSCGIEFAAGLAIDDTRDRVVVSWGTEDQDAWIGETRLEAVLATLVPAEALEAVKAMR